MGWKNDDFREIPGILVLTIAMLLLLSLIPAYKSGNISIRRVNMLSDLTRKPSSAKEKIAEKDLFAYPFTEQETETPAPGENIPDTDTASLPEPAPPQTTTPAPSPAALPLTTSISSTADTIIIEKPKQSTAPYIPKEGVTPIEDYSEDKRGLANYFKALNPKGKNRRVRIAFVGDSFIEGDILTGHVREALQAKYGGQGVGFAPFVVPNNSRPTLWQEYGEWDVYGIAPPYGKGSPGRFILNGQYFIPRAGAWSKMQCTHMLKHAVSSTKIKILYTASACDTISVTINNGTEKQYRLSPTDGLRLYEIEHGDVRSVRFTLPNAQGFVGYGAFLEGDTGVFVDNYSLRSSTGITLDRLDPGYLQQLDSLVGYDLVILQYGLNVVEEEKTSYRGYKNSMVAVAGQLQAAMPETDFMIMGMGDRNYTNGEGEIETPEAVIRMVEAQRQIAKEAKITFWNTFMAMGGRESIYEYAHSTPPLANKDYAHINHAGGKKLADAFTAALEDIEKTYDNN